MEVVSGVHTGVENTLSGVGTGIQIGSNNTITNTGSAPHYGTMNELSGNGTGIQYGTYTDINTGMAAAQFGNYNNLLAGLNNNMAITGMLNNLDHFGSGLSKGVFNFINHNGSGQSIATHNQINAFSANKQVGTKNEIYGEASATGIHMAIENFINTEAGENYGVFSQMEGSSNSAQFGTRHNINVTGDGTHYGILNNIDNDGNGDHRGTYNYLSGSGTGIHYGTFNSINSVGSGDKYGTYNIVFGTSTMGKNIAGYFNAGGGSEAYAAIFAKGKIIMNDFNTDSDLQVKSQLFDNMLLVDASQNRIGIRTANPQDILHVNASTSESAFHVEVGGNTKFRVHSNGSISIGSNNTGVSANDTYFDNQVGFGVVTPTYRIELENNTANGQGRGRAFAWDVYSDQRVKKEVKSLSYGLTELMKMNPVSYHHHASSFENGVLTIKNEYAKAIGFIAQEMYDIIPEVVSKPKDEQVDLWSMDYEKIIPVLVNSIKEQQKLIMAQQAKVHELEMTLKSYDTKFAALEAKLEARLKEN
jgi:hypothetical protein